MAGQVRCPVCATDCGVPGPGAKALACPNCGEAVAVPGPAKPVPKRPPVQARFLDEFLAPGERLLAVSRVHAVVMLVPAVVLVLGLVVVVVGLVAGDRGSLIVGIAVAAIGALALLGRLVRRATAEVACTDRRLLMRSGLLVTSLQEMPLAKVESLLVEQGLLGGLLGYGTLVFRGSGGTAQVWKDIEDAVGFREAIGDAAGKLR